MERLTNHKALKYNPDTLVSLRKLYDLDKPGQIEQSIDILEEWIKKQSHFVRKDYPRDHLERVIIQLKGSVERAKGYMDKISTLRTLLPKYFEKCDVKNDFKILDSYVTTTLLPKPTKENYRVLAGKYEPLKYSPNIFFHIYAFNILICEYLKAYDYCNGLITIIDVRNINIMDFVAQLNLTELKEILTISMEGYDMRIKNFLFITTSKTVDVLVKLLKQMLSEKLGNRIHVVKDVEELKQHIPRELLPKDYGGDEKSLAELAAREYLERVIIQQKGSVERAKSFMDNICTLRTLLPKYFEKCDAKKDFKILKEHLTTALLPNLTKENVRTLFYRIGSLQFSSNILIHMYCQLASICEYIKMYDYCYGLMIVLDFRGVNIVDFVPAINLFELREFCTLLLDGYEMRIQKFLFLTSSKAIEILVKLLKQINTEKLGNRIEIVGDEEDLQKHISRELLPSDYGGDEKSLAELSDDMMEDLGSAETVNLLKAMTKAQTVESMRTSSKYRGDFTGLEGTFRTLSVD